MNRKLVALSRQYLLALRKHLQQGLHASLQPALVLGRRAEFLELETLDVARIHEHALAALKVPDARNGLRKRAEMFFAEVIIPIERTHRAALNSNVQLSRLNATLLRRTIDLAASQKLLQQGIIHRKTVQRALRKSGAHSQKLLTESLRLQRHLQRLTHQLLSAQEDKRKKVSRNLHDDIAQTLLGINVRLLTLKKEAEVNAQGLRKEIVSTQGLVDKSVKTIKRFAREFGRQRQT
jgi:two-component system sensor histidine kinase DegS